MYICFQVVTSILEKLPKLEANNSECSSDLANYLSHALSDSVCTLMELAPLFHHGKHYPLFYTVLQKIHEQHQGTYLKDLLKKSKLNLTNMMPGKYILPSVE